MKSILAQQSLQSSPWAPARLRQEMQTGGSKGSAASANMLRKASPAKKGLGRGVGRSEVISAPSIAMAVMIERGWGE